MTKLRSGKRTATNNGDDDAGAASKGASKGATKEKQPPAKKKRSADDFEEDSKTLKKAKPSICKAAEELVCPILQGLPIDPVIAEDVSRVIYCDTTASERFFIFSFSFACSHNIHVYLSVLCDRRAKFTSERRSRSISRRRKMKTRSCLQ